jgi:signal transduction histidine kinase
MKRQKPWFPLLLLFVFLNAFFLTGKNFLVKQGIDHLVLIGGNLVLFIATALSFYVSYKSVTSPNPHSSVRSLYGSFMIKFFLIIIAAFVYIMVAKKELNKPALFICMGLYLVYTVVEVAALQKLLKQQRQEKAANHS